MTSTKERNLNHAHAHTSISIHTHIVRYYSLTVGSTWKCVSSSSVVQGRINHQEQLQSRLTTLDQHITEEDDESYAKNTLGDEQYLQEEYKVLGVHWNIIEDRLVLNMNHIAESARTLEPSKRNIVSLVSRFYDPLGIITPVKIQFKMLAQDLCEVKLSLDQSISGELLSEWNRLVDSLQQASSISVPRCYFLGIEKANMVCSLHGFSEAS